MYQGQANNYSFFNFTTVHLFPKSFQVQLMRHDKWRLCSLRGTVHFFHSVKDVVALFYFAKCNLSFLGWTSVSWWISMLSLYIFLPKNPKKQRKSAARSNISAFCSVFYRSEVSLHYWTTRDLHEMHQKVSVTRFYRELHLLKIEIHKESSG